MKNSIRIFGIIVFSIAGIMFSAQASLAASISFQSSSSQIFTDSEFYVDVYVDTQGESINTIGLSVVVPEEFRFLYANIDKSIIPLWVESPRVVESTIVSLSGIIPGGFNGYIDPFDVRNRAPGVVVRLHFVPEETGVFNMSARDIEIYRNDGTGSRISATVVPQKIAVQESITPTVSRIVDTEQPLPFVPSVLSDPLLHDGLFVVIFTTKDLGSGIEYYEVRENSGQWRKGTSPYVLQNQKRLFSVEVRAVDRTGNQRLASAEIPVELQRDRIPLVWIGMGIALLVGCAILILKWKHIVLYKRKK
jgi:hypothetical protein